MTFHFLFDLSEGWAVGGDERQWLILRRPNFRAQRDWNPFAYVATKRDILPRVLSETGMELYGPTQTSLACLSKSFMKWRTLNLVEIWR